MILGKVIGNNFYLPNKDFTVPYFSANFILYTYKTKFCRIEKWYAGIKKWYARTEKWYARTEKWYARTEKWYPGDRKVDGPGINKWVAKKESFTNNQIKNQFSPFLLRILVDFTKIILPINLGYSNKLGEKDCYWKIVFFSVLNPFD